MSGFKTKKITSDGFGLLLKKARKKKKISLDEAEISTTVRKKYLRAFEEEDFSNMPDNVYALGYLKKYCDFLDIKTDEIVSQFRQTGNYVKNNLDLINPKKITDFRFVFTPRILLVSCVFAAVFIFVGYIWLQFKVFTSAPPLKILSPSDQAYVTKDVINVAGLTDEGAKLTINSEPIRLDEDGKFQTDIKLQDGVNTIEIVSENKIKKQSKKTLKVLARLK